LSHEILLWAAFNLFVVIMLVLDLKVFHRKAHEVYIKEALWFSLFWICLALAFNAGVYYFMGKQKAVEFLAAYLVEKSLSIDNLFVFLLIFQSFKTHPIYHHKILFWGILGALIMRTIFIFTGVALIEKFGWIIYVFGAFLIYTGIKIAFEKDKEVHPEKNPLLIFFRKILPVTDTYREGHFWVRENGKFFFTPLFLVLLFIEFTDVVFAVDSVPACLAITLDPFIVYTANVFAILGLRALYFSIAGVMRLFHYLHYGLAIILVFVGVKMVGAHYFHIPVGIALGVITVVLVFSILASVIWPKKHPHHPHDHSVPPSRD
jgi:tellurite resistance protein TerC